jgi:predicted amidohydrolase
MKLVAVADEASEGVGAPRNVAGDDYFLDVTTGFLRFVDATLRSEIADTRLRVLPRVHTPQNGLTERSLSSHLSLCDAGEVTPQWLSTPFLKSDSINLLLVPWPLEVVASQFRDVTDSATLELPESFGFFTYDLRGKNEDVVGAVKALHGEAIRKLGRIDGVVLPELAVTGQQFEDLRLVLPPECFLVAGVGRSATVDQRGTNQVRLSFPPLEEVFQKKHHPWKLNEAQVIQYGIGGVLSPSREWWEYADFTDRRLKFVSVSEDIVVCALICEDLARPDPVADIVRTVGPNLVIALLMDGPQTKERWAARYATVLADDPGCSVLSLTSLGMAQLSRPESGPSRSQVIALWKDSFRLRSATEIELAHGCAAVAVSLSIREREEYTADGRSDSVACLILSGVHSIADPRGASKG